jgi:proline iminopeptidase
MLAVEAALRWPHRFTAMILASPCLSMERTIKDMNRLRSALPASVQTTLSNLEAKQQTDSTHYQMAAVVFYQRHLCRLKPWPGVLEVSPETWGIEVYRSMWGPVEFLPNGSLSDYEREQDIRLLEMPILFTCGRFDEITPEATTCYYNASKNGSLHVFENSAHLAHLEEPDVFLKVVKDFLGSLIKSPSDD